MIHAPTALNSRRLAAASRLSAASRLLAAMAVMPAGFVLTSTSSAATLFWDAGSANITGNGNSTSLGGTGTWNTTIKNWDVGAVPYVSWNNTLNASDTAVFGGGTTTGTRTVTVGTITAGIVDIRSSRYTFTGGTMTFSGGTIEVNNSNSTGNGDSAVFNTLLAGSLTYKATGATTTTAQGGGIGTIAGNNTGLTSFELSAATDSNQLLVSNAGSFGSAGATLKLTKGIAGLSATNGTTYNAWNTEFAGGSLRLRVAGNSTFAGSGTLSANTAFATIAGANLICSGTLALGANTLTLSPQSSTGAVTINNSVSGSGNLTLGAYTAASADGTGTAALNAANTYSGQTTISSNGTLVIGPSGSINTSSGVVINSGRFRYENTATPLTAPIALNSGTLTGTGAVTLGSVSVSNNASAIITNNNGTAGAGITVGNLTFNGAATLNLKLDAASTSAIIGANALSTNAAGTVSLNATTNTGLWSTGSAYNLITYTGGSVGGAGFGQFSLNSITGLTSRQSSVFSDTGSAITLTINGDNPYWIGGSNGNWNTSQTGNWRLVTAGTDTTFLQNDEVHFTDAVGGGATNVNVTENVSTTAILFNNTTKDYVIGSSGGFGITSAVSVTKAGTGMVTLSSNNTYSGSTAITAGTLQAQGGSAIGDSSVVTLSDVASATLDIQASETIAGLTGGGTSGGTVSIANGQTLTIGGSTAQTFAGNLSGTGGLSLIGTANHTFTGSPSYTGGTSIASGARLAINRSDVVNFNSALSGSGIFAVAGNGTVTLGNSSTFNGTVSIASTTGTTLDIGSRNQTIGALSGGNSTGGLVALGSGNLTITGSSNQTYSGKFSGSGDIIVAAGANPVNFAGTNTGQSTSFTGNVRVQSGNLVLGKTGDILGTNSSGLGTQAVFVSAVASTKLNYGNAAYNQNQNFVINGTGSDSLGALQALGMNFGSAAIGGIVAESDSLVRVTRDNSAGSQTLLVRNALAGSGNLTFDGGSVSKPGIAQLNVASGNLTLGGNVYQAFSGNLGLAGGMTLISNAANALGNVKAVTVASGTVLTFNSSANQTIGALSGAGTVNINGNTLTVGAGDLAGTFSGTLQNASGVGSLTKLGLGTQTLSGVNSYSGATTVSGGTLLVDTTGSMANTSGISVATGATFTYNSSSSLSKAISVTEGAGIGGTGALTATNLSFSADLGDGISSVSLGSAFSKGGELSFNLTGINDGTYSIFSGTSVGGSFTSVRLNGTLLEGSSNVFSGMVNSISYTYTDSLNQLVVSSIPEPSSFAVLVGFGALGAVGLRRRRR